MQMAVGEGALPPPPVPVGAGDRATTGPSSRDRGADSAAVVRKAA